LNFFIESGLPFGIPSFQKIKEEKQEKCVKVDTKYNHYTRYKFIPHRRGGVFCPPAGYPPSLGKKVSWIYRGDGTLRECRTIFFRKLDF
jgi:hypothetical protein